MICSFDYSVGNDNHINQNKDDNNDVIENDDRSGSQD